MVKVLFKRVVTSSLFRSSGIYTISNFINAAIPLLLLPILTKLLSPADYGIVAMFQLTIGVVYPFISINLVGAISRKYYDNDDADFPSYITSCFLLTLISYFIVAIVFWSFSGFIQQMTQIPAYWLNYALVTSFCQFSIAVAFVIYQVKVQPIKYGIFQVLQTIFNVCLTLYLLMVLNRKWEGRLEAQTYTTVLFAVLSMIILAKGRFFEFKIKKEHFEHALKFGVPLIPHAIGGILFTAIDRVFLTKLIGLEQTGNYSVAYQIGAVVSLITLAFNNAFVPWLYENLNKNDLGIKLKIVKFTYLYFVLAAVGAIVLILTFPLLVSIFVNGAYDTINTYSLFIVFGFAFQGMYFMITNYIAYAQKTYVQGGITILVAILKIPITYFLILWLGAVGAAISFCLTYLLLFLFTWVYSDKVYPMPWNLLKYK